ncbi:MAG: glycosyltransferase family 2 protein [Chthoniobacteraceae bacterium]|jgi:glycosyltransferase involved in cell wall biosynthesis
MAGPLNLSLAIISFNEEDNLRRCLRSAAHLAREIILLDSGSTDRTCDVARDFGARIQHQDYLGQRDQKAAAVALCTMPWVLILDCDEELSPELKSSIISFFNSGDSEKFSGARMPRKVWFMGRWIIHGDWYPDRKLRLFRRDRGRCAGDAAHDKVQVDGPVKTLEGDLHHYSFRDMRHYIAKINTFSDAFLEKQKTEGARWSLPATLFRPSWRFFRAYIIRRGFLDGFPGLWIALSTAYFTFIRYSRKYEDEAPRLP